MPLHRRPGFRTAFALFAAMLLPGLGGAWLRYAHDCPAQRSAVTAQVETTQAAHGAEHDHESQDGTPAHGEHQTCHCVGACDSGAQRALPTSKEEIVFAALLPAPPRSFAPRAALVLPVATPSDLLPLPNAPPIA